MMRKTRGVGVPRPLGKAAVPMRKLAGFLLAAVLLTLPVRALEPVVEPIAASGYTYYVIDAGGKLYAWGDSFHGAVGPADQDPLYWEDANILLENARYVAAGFVMAAAIDTDGALWGWGGHAGRTFGEEEPYRLLEDVAEVSIGDTSCTALRTDGTVWIWGARSGESLKKHPDDPFFRPVQVLDHVARLEGDMAVLEDGSLWQIPAAYMLSDWQENRDRTPNRPEKILDQALAPGTPPEWPEEAPAPEVLPAASLEIWQAEQENAEAEPVPLEPQAEPSTEPAAPESSPAASLAAVITSAAALALVGWLRSRRH